MLSDDLSASDLADFWKSVRKLNVSKTPLTNTLDNVSGESNIAEKWKKHFSSILNSVSNCQYKGEVYDAVTETHFDTNMIVSVSDVKDVILSL